LGRRALPANTIGAAALAVLAADPQQLFSPGFQLSFAVVAALVAWTGALAARMPRVGGPDPWLPEDLWTWRDRWGGAVAEGVRGTAATSVAAWLGSAPFGLWYFQFISPVAVFANILAVPMAFAVLGLGVLSSVSAVFVPGWVGTFNSANWLVARALVEGLRPLAGMPLGHFQCAPAAWWDRGPSVVVFDLESGGAAVVRGGGRTWLVDCGSARDVEARVGRYLRERGIGRIDGLVLTHGDVGHIGGAEEVLRAFRPRRVIEGASEDRSPTRRAFRARAAAAGVTVERLSAGARIEVGGGVALAVLDPVPGELGRHADDLALVVRVEMPGGAVLLQGDAGYAAERRMLERGERVRADVWVKGWHTNDRLGSDGWVGAVAPSVAVAAWDRFEGPGWIDPGWAGEVARSGADLLRQEACGAVTVRGGAAGLSVRPFLGDQTLTSRAR
jgi:beta-lactamase superfamily II metal-dependent hydrolase